MRTITENLLERLKAQADEADTLGKTVLAEAITNQLCKSSVRKDNTLYIYASDELKSDVQNCLWDAAIRISDFCGTSLDMEKVNQSVQSFANIFIDTLMKDAHIYSGAYEETLPGEAKEHTVFEVVEKE